MDPSKKNLLTVLFVLAVVVMLLTMHWRLILFFEWLPRNIPLQTHMIIVYYT